MPGKRNENGQTNGKEKEKHEKQKRKTVLEGEEKEEVDTREEEKVIREDRPWYPRRVITTTEGLDLRGQFTRIKWVINVIMAKL